MKILSAIIFLIGILLTVYTGFQLVTEETILEIGSLEVTKDKKHNISWTPIVGVVLIVIGAGGYFYAVNKDKSY